MARATSKAETKSAKSTKAETNNLDKQIKQQKENTQALRKRISGLADDIYVLRGELDLFKKQVTNDLNSVINGMENLAKNQKNN